MSAIDGIVLVALLIAVLGMQIFLSLREGYHEHEDDVVTEIDEEKAEQSVARGLGFLFIGILMLVVSSRAIVWGAVGRHWVCKLGD